MPGAVGRTSTFALCNVTLPWVLEIAQRGIEAAARDLRPVARAINIVRRRSDEQGGGRDVWPAVQTLRFATSLASDCAARSTRRTIAGTMTEIPATIRWVGDVDGHLRAARSNAAAGGSRRISTAARSKTCGKRSSSSCVRGAPAIGVAAAYGVCVGVQRTAASVDEVCDYLATSRARRR